MKLRARASPLRTDAGKAAYLACIEDGPLARIFRDERLRLAPAKGAAVFRSQEKYAHVYDQTYFAHALNVAVTAGVLFEATTLQGQGGEPGEQEMRIILAAGALHDFNKLTLFSGGRDLAAALRAAKEPARELLAGYVPEADVETVFHLALGTEASDRGEASAYGVVLPPRRVTLAAWCLQLADRLGGTYADPNDSEGYRVAAEDFRRVQARVLPEIQVQPLALLPQPSLARAARRLLIDWIRENGTLLHETERYVSWIGPKPGSKEIEAMDEALWAAVQPVPKVAFDKAGISHNAIRTSWTRFLEPTPEVIDKWILHHGGRLVVWQGDWGRRHFEKLEREFPGVFVYEKPPRDRVRVELPEDDPEGDERARRPHRLAKLVIAHCIRQALSKARTLPPEVPSDYETEDLQGVMGATVPGILWARAERDDPEAYPRALDEVSRLLRESRREMAPPARGVVQALLGVPELPTVGRTGEACIYCGAAAESGVEDALVFGIKPTAWAPRKAGVQRETHTGRICDGCILENLLRDEMASLTETPPSDKGYLTVHVHAADLVCDVKWETFKPLLQGERAVPGREAVFLFPKGKKGDRITGGQIVPLRGHVSIPMPKPAASGSTGETLAHLYRLRDCLAFVRETGFKLHVSPIGLTPAQERAQFRWTNAPAWMESLGLAEVHVDELLPAAQGRRRPGKPQVAEALLSAGFAAGGAQGHRSFIAKLLREPLSLYDLSEPDKTPSPDPDHFLNVLEDAYVPDDKKAGLTRAALAYIRFNARGSWSNNTWTWATRHYLDLRDRYGSDHRDLLVGDLLAAAQRKWDATPVDQVEEFVDAMNDFLVQFRGGKPLASQDRRVVINAVSHLARKNYRTVFPKEASA